MYNVMKSCLNGKTFLQISFFIFLSTQICYAQGSWAHIGEMPEIRLSHTANELNGKIYIVGGWNTEQGPILTTMLVYDRAETTWTTIPLLNNEYRGAHTSIVVDSKLYVIGGYAYSGPNYVASAKVDMYDPNTGLWTSKNPMPTPRATLACASIEDKIYVMGGMDVVSWTGLKTLEVYDVSTNEWTQLADMPTRRWGLSAVAYNGKIYVFGGAAGVATTVYDSVQVYDPQTNTWTVKSNMPTKRYSLTTCLLDNKIYAIDGWLHSNYGPIYDKVEVYIPESDTWYTETPMPVARALLASIVLDGKIQVFGGSSTTHPLIGSSGIYEFSNNDPLPEGTYSVGTSGYFTTIQAAFDKLSTDGVAGPVTLELIDNLYIAPTDTFGFFLNGPIPGAGLNSRVTIKPAANKNVTIEGNSYAVMYFMNTSYVTLDGVGLTGATTLTIHSIQNSQFAFNFGIFFADNSDHNVIQNTTGICEDIYRGAEPILFYVETAGISSAPDSNLIQNNFIKEAGVAILVSAEFSLVKAVGNIIRENIVGSETDSLISWGIQVQFTQNTIIENNIVQNIRRYYWKPNPGINSYFGFGDIIRNNIVHNIYVNTGTYGGIGILLSGDVGKTGSNNLVYNNMVYDIRSSSTQAGASVGGIQMWFQDSPKVYYNSVYLKGDGNGANSNGSAALYVSNNCTNVEAQNNIFVNTRDESPYCASSIRNYSASNLTSNFNDLYYEPTQYSCLVRIGSTNYNTLAEWQVTGQDSNSVSEMPNFINPYLHIDESILTNLDSSATPISGIDTDFDGELRNVNTPDIGADEFDIIIIGVEDETDLPTEFALEQNYPNPFNPSTKIKYSISERSNVSLKVFDLLGSEVVELVKGEIESGTYDINFNASNLPSGVYFYQLKAGEYINTKKMLLLK